MSNSFGELSEWFKVQSWKGCVVNATMSSNLILSASKDTRPCKWAFFMRFAHGGILLVRSY